ncbi:rRNA-binding endoribonuclease [Sporobolomyces koalae]|uniref:rRNA-binding endoribonuclease n=1 Tax=Sporobolomyces koalae TaxID=500713 RepID=UPI0031818BC1
MASKQPTASLASAPSVKHLIVDSSPLLTAPLSSLRGIATHYLVTPDVVHELRDKNGRNVLDEAALQLPADSLPQDSEPDVDDEMLRKHDGFQVREPTAEAIAKITAFARKTGDIAVLSATDIRVLALCLTLELEENGTWRVRDHPGQVLTGPPKEDAKSKTAGSTKGDDETKEENKVELVASVDEAADKLESLQVADPTPEKVSAAPSSKDTLEPSSSQDLPTASTSTLPPSTDAGPSASSAEEESVPSHSTDEPAPEHPAEAEEQDDGDDSDAESTSSSGSWITPSNIHSHKVKDLGLFSAPSTSKTQQKPRTILKAAVLTGDFAMQNVGLQMGLNVLGSGGKRVKEVRTWVLRCHACFKLCKNPEKRFCPSCGGPTLLRTSITYVPSTPQNPQGYILHLKQNYNYRLRGTQYSLPTPQMGKAGGQGKKAEPVLREDQKEWIKGVKSQEVRQMKEQRALVKAVLDEEKKGKGKGRSNGSSSSTGFFQGAGGAYGLESAMLGMAGPKGGIEHQKGRRRGGKNGAGGETRLDSSGLPVIGSGRKNPNEARRRR